MKPQRVSLTPQQPTENADKGRKIASKGSGNSRARESLSSQTSGLNLSDSREGSVGKGRDILVVTRRSERRKEVDNCSKNSSSREGSVDIDSMNSRETNKSQGPALQRSYSELPSKSSLLRDSSGESSSDNKCISDNKNIAHDSQSSSENQSRKETAIQADLLAISRQRLSEQLRAATSTCADDALSSAPSLSQAKLGTEHRSSPSKPVMLRTVTPSLLRKTDKPEAAKPRKTVLSAQSSSTSTSVMSNHSNTMPVAILLTGKKNSISKANLQQISIVETPKLESLWQTSSVVKSLEVKDQRKSVEECVLSKQEEGKANETAPPKSNATSVAKGAKMTEKSVKDNAHLNEKSEMIKVDTVESKTSNIAKTRTSKVNLTPEQPVVMSSQRPQRKRRAPLKIAESIGEKSSEPFRADVSKKMRLDLNLAPTVSTCKASVDPIIINLEVDEGDKIEDISSFDDDGKEEDEERSATLVEEIWMEKKPGRPTERVRSNRIYVVEPSKAGRLTCQDTRKVGQIVDETGLTCLQCDQRFTSVSNLRRHAIRHLGWRRFKCRLCRFCSYNRSECHTHILRAHPERLRLMGGGGTRIDSLITDLNRQAASVRSLKKRQTLEERRSLEEQQEEEVMGQGSSQLPLVSGSGRKKSDEKMPEREANSNLAGSSSIPDMTPQPVVAQRSSRRRKRDASATSDGENKLLQGSPFNISTRNSPRKFDIRPYPRPQDSTVSTDQPSHPNTSVSESPVTLSQTNAQKTPATKPPSMEPTRRPQSQVAQLKPTAQPPQANITDDTLLLNTDTFATVNVLLAADDKGGQQPKSNPVDSQKKKVSTVAKMGLRSSKSREGRESGKEEEPKQQAVPQDTSTDSVVVTAVYAGARANIPVPPAVLINQEKEVPSTNNPELPSFSGIANVRRDASLSTLSDAGSSVSVNSYTQPAGNMPVNRESFSAALINKAVIINVDDDENDDDAKLVDVVVSCDFLQYMDSERGLESGACNLVSEGKDSSFASSTDSAGVPLKPKIYVACNKSEGVGFVSSTENEMMDGLKEMETLPEHFMSGDVPSPAAEIVLDIAH